MALRYSKPFTISVDGKNMLEAQSAETTYDSEDKLVKTMALGAAGFSDGAGSVKMSFKSAIPREGYEIDYADYCMGHKDAVVVVRAANVVDTVRGRFLTAKSGSGTDNPNEASAEFEGILVSRVKL
jgi:hypothetical protein